VPLVAMLVSLDDPRAIIQFWRLEAEAMRDSGLLALATGAVALVVAVLTAFALGHPGALVRRLAAGSVLVLCMLGLIPGVLVGAAIARIGFFGLDSGWSAAWLASCIRCAFLGSIVGALCASSETGDRRAARHQLAGGSVRGWVLTALPVFVMPMLGVLLISALYALQEIEAAVMVRPPGMANLPQQLLSDLHFARLEQLSAAGVNLLVIGMGVSLAGSLLLVRIIRIPRSGN